MHQYLFTVREKDFFFARLIRRELFFKEHFINFNRTLVYNLNTHIFCYINLFF